MCNITNEYNNAIEEIAAITIAPVDTVAAITIAYLTVISIILQELINDVASEIRAIFKSMLFPKPSFLIFPV